MINFDIGPKLQCGHVQGAHHALFRLHDGHHRKGIIFHSSRFGHANRNISIKFEIAVALPLDSEWRSQHLDKPLVMPVKCLGIYLNGELEILSLSHSMHPHVLTGP